LFAKINKTPQTTKENKISLQNTIFFPSKKKNETQINFVFFFFSFLLPRMNTQNYIVCFDCFSLIFVYNVGALYFPFVVVSPFWLCFIFFLLLYKQKNFEQFPYNNLTMNKFLILLLKIFYYDVNMTLLDGIRLKFNMPNIYLLLKKIKKNSVIRLDFNIFIIILFERLRWFFFLESPSIVKLNIIC
jgi:hypothetical protein